MTNETRRLPMIDVQTVWKTYNGDPVLRGLSLAVHPGEVAVIIGRSGSGKTTLLRCINHLETIDQGRIYIDGALIGYQEVQGRLVEEKEMAVARIRAQVGMVFQRFHLFPHLTVLQNVVAAPTWVRHRPYQQAKQHAQQLLAQVSLTDKEHAYPLTLSGGQQQRVAIARALAMDPKVMLFDEPTSALDAELVGEVVSVIQNLASTGMTILIVSHDLTFARAVGTRIIYMDQGVVVEEGPTDLLFSMPQNERTQRFLRNWYEKSHINMPITPERM